MNIACHEQPFRTDDLMAAPEVMICGTTTCLTAVCSVDGRQIGWKSDVIDSATGKSAGPELAPGTPYRLQYVFDAEPGRKLKEFTLAMPAGRTIVVDAR